MTFCVKQRNNVSILLSKPDMVLHMVIEENVSQFNKFNLKKRNRLVFEVSKYQ